MICCHVNDTEEVRWIGVQATVAGLAAKPWDKLMDGHEYYYQGKEYVWGRADGVQPADEANR